MGKYTTHLATNDRCDIKWRDWHHHRIIYGYNNGVDSMICNSTICKTERPTRLTHKRHMVSCKRCLKLLPEDRQPAMIPEIKP